MAEREGPTGRVLADGLLAGWGAFNLVEGTIDHSFWAFTTGARGPDQLLYDIGFLIWGAVMLAVRPYLLRALPEAAAGSGDQGVNRDGDTIEP